MAAEVCEAAEALHVRNIVHRDISPANVIVAADGAHLIDLGIARLRVEGVSKDTSKLGTWGFASPEQFGFAQTDARSDVYSIGRLLGYMLTGVRPDEEAYEKALDDQAKVPPAYRAVIDHACAFEPSGRYQSARELSAALQAAAKGEVASVVSVPPASPLPAGSVPANTALASPVSTNGAPSSANTTGNTGATGTTAQSVVTSLDEGHSSSNVAVPDSGLSVVESGWSCNAQGYVTYVFALRNDSGTDTVSFPQVTVTGKSADGTVLFSQDSGAMGLGPGETQYCYNSANSGTAPAVVEFTPVKPSSYNIVQSGKGGSLVVSNVAINKPQYGNSKVTGEVRVDELSTLQFVGDQIRLVAILRDANGNIVSGDVSFVTNPGQGQSTAFSIGLNSNVAFETVEVYASPW